MNPPLRPDDKITCVIHDRMGRYVLQAWVARVEPPGPSNGGRPRVYYCSTASTPLKAVCLEEEGITWCRGWGDTEALLAANSLVRSAAK